MNLLDILAHLPTIETERLLLRKITLNDASDMFEYASNPEVSQYTMWSTHTSLEDTKYFLRSLTKMYKRRELVDWGIVHKAEKKFIGTCGFVEWSMTHSRAEICPCRLQNTCVPTSSAGRRSSPSSRRGAC